MDVYERLYECGRAYLRLRTEKRESAIKAVDSIEAALADLDHRVTKFLKWAERYEDPTLTPEEVRVREGEWPVRWRP